MRGTGADAKPALLRVDGAGKIEVVALDGLKFTKASLPNAPAAAEGQRNPRMESITDMAFVDGQLFVAGLSNEEFASKLRAVPVSVHGSGPARASRSTTAPTASWRRGRRSARSSPTRSNISEHLIAGYTCTPLVKFPVVEPEAGREGHGHDDRRARQPQPADRHDRLQEGRQGLPADGQHQPRRDEDADRRLRDRPGITARVQRTAASASSRSRRSRASSSSTCSTHRAIVLTRAEGGRCASGRRAAVVHEVHGFIRFKVHSVHGRNGGGAVSSSARRGPRFCSLLLLSALYAACAGSDSSAPPQIQLNAQTNTVEVTGLPAATVAALSGSGWRLEVGHVAVGGRQQHVVGDVDERKALEVHRRME